VVMVLALSRRLTDYYWFNLPKEAGFPFLALVEHTNFLPPEHYGGDHLVYCGDYLEPDHEFFRLSPEALLERFLPSLERDDIQLVPASSLAELSASARMSPPHRALKEETGDY